MRRQNYEQQCIRIRILTPPKFANLNCLKEATAASIIINNKVLQ